ncbi:MAG: hypothetical protein D6714_18500, partial [Bacteroidetes bacterium]
MQLFSTVLILGTAGTPDWQTFESYEGRFRVLAPGAMTEKIDSIQTDVGTLAYHVFFHQSDNKDADNLFYMVSYCDYPAGSVHSDSTELLAPFFEATLESAAASVDGKLIYADDIRYDDYPGKFWRIDYLDGQAIIKTKAFLVKNRYYSLQ